jgi:hypothetical protein
MKQALVPLLALAILALGGLACGGGAPTNPDRFMFWTETPNASQTPLVVQITTTPNDTPTP